MSDFVKGHASRPKGGNTFAFNLLYNDLFRGNSTCCCKVALTPHMTFCSTFLRIAEVKFL